MYLILMCRLLSTGVGVEGILRQSADVEDVERRVREYEQGFTWFFVYLMCCASVRDRWPHGIKYHRSF